MHYIIIAATIILMLLSGCSTLEKMVYHPNINQGNFLTFKDISKISLGMTQKQVAYVLGTPIMSDPFNSNTWFYVFRQQLDNKSEIQQTLTLTFNSNGILTNIDNKPWIDQLNSKAP